MGKTIKKSRKRTQTISSLTKRDLEEMAQSLVERGLATRSILEGAFFRENRNRSTYMREGKKK